MAQLLPTSWLRCSQVSVDISNSRPRTGAPCASEPNTLSGEGSPRTVTAAQTCNTALCCLAFLQHSFPEAQDLNGPTSATTQLWSRKVLCERRYPQLCRDLAVTAGFDSALSMNHELSLNGPGHAPAQPQGTGWSAFAQAPSSFSIPRALGLKWPRCFVQHHCSPHSGQGLPSSADPGTLWCGCLLSHRPHTLPAPQDQGGGQGHSCMG